MFISTTPKTDRTALSGDNAEIIRQTLPVIGDNINAITPVFYRTMFTNHPELLADTFNRGNQRSGEQQKALAASIVTFAAMLVDDNAPDPVEMLSRIGHKHVSLGITADQYQIVHDNLFSAIVEVLGEAITPEIAAAWDEVYWLMADVLIDYEADLYKSAGVEAGDVFRKVVLKDKKQLSEAVTEYTFAGHGFDKALAGQYTSIGVELPDGARQLRQYSLISHDADGFSVAVQRDGEVSSFLLNDVNVGDEVDATLPAGDLVLQPGESPVVLVSQGIGSTPMTGMLASLVAAQGQVDRPVVVLHADADETAYAQRETTEKLVAALQEKGSAEHITAYRDRGESLDLAKLLADGKLPTNAEWYLCGGNNFLQNVREQLEAGAADLAPAAIHFELFSPNDWLIG
ncbi:globin domain-containing protein [Corynebacterium auriscanis]|uniref:nitric oxide dioxygenase n=1 Tax=Corynebacterium auriscanis TaxID=99807 RepID=A0A0A2DHG2_9CORY|nr:globin domain-containing protein [Corynebacterium auriscanis]KGM18608.1 hemin transporter [Corynebacterium auriscanis]WJY72075.1 Flavohemoprotein [Corynebacterium auriscanis]